MEWDPTQFFRDDHTPNPFALLILNQPINERAFRVLKRHAKITLCADGGANRFYSMMEAHDRESTDLPDLIIGDLDSITPDTRAHYANLGVRIIEDEDQYSTDFTKCLDYLRAHVGDFISSSSSVSKPEGEEQNEQGGRGSELDVLILGGLGGRVDQAFSQIHHLYSMTQTYSSSTSNQEGTGKIGNLYLISEESITFILRPGVSTIRTPGTNRPGVSPAEQGEDLLEENVGIIPLSGPARITTSGFQWDVVDWRTEIGGQLSTSNHIRSEVVTVESLVPVLFTVELAERLKRTR
ncbi:thiamine pyrophosphokinase [Aspergillus pseudonomiae]|uniref:Thiamine pyrophosphokinase n=1 Tax=Aspergillus pseudonomiae TaxID=1506151 RepID=A0A5N7DRI2_9EURO|nr:thiamine pyrophosphokinase [Aspergillus pseudonomiae]KAE8408895.1 thiamine pyrophosphokinase [Aspergillus pseudonomiae]